MDNPCRYCADYPHYCRGLCKDKMKYINEIDGNVPVVENPKKTHIFREGTKAYEYNKNGIKREIRR